MDILIATHNPSKLERFHHILDGIPGFRLVSLSEVGINAKADEPYDSSRKNAIHKTQHYGDQSGLLTIGIDEAVTTNFLPVHEQPGVFLRRLTKSEREFSDLEIIQYWKGLFAKYPGPDKSFIWDISIAYYDPKKPQLGFTQIECVSRVANHWSDVVLPGYPMGSFLIPDGTDKPYSELGEDEIVRLNQQLFRKFRDDFCYWIQNVATQAGE